MLVLNTGGELNMTIEENKESGLEAEIEELMKGYKGGIHLEVKEFFDGKFEKDNNT